MPADYVIENWLSGDDPQSIADGYAHTGVTPAGVFQVLAYYLSHRDEVDQWLEAQEQWARRLQEHFEREFPPGVTGEELRRRWAERNAAVSG